MEYPKPSVTADMIVYSDEFSSCYVLMIRRKNPPYAGWWALPGGFMEPGETIEQAAQRELIEETGLSQVSCRLLDVFSEPGRDPRGWTMTVAYLAGVNRASVRPQGMDDAAEAAWFSCSVSEVPGGIDLRLTPVDGGTSLSASLRDPFVSCGKIRYQTQITDGIAFDHAKILAAAFAE